MVPAIQTTLNDFVTTFIPALINVITQLVKTRGKPAVLRFDLFDDSGTSSAVIRVYEGQSLLATLTSPAVFKIGARSVTVRWRVPKKLRSRQLRFCVVASDPTGNRSTPTCAPFLDVR